MSDSLGRFFRICREGERIEGVITKEGKRPSRVSVKVADHAETKIVLKSR